MAIVLGKNFMLYFERDGAKVPVCYAESVSLNINGELLEATKNINTNWRSHYIGMLDYDLTAEGVVESDESATYNVLSMQQALMARASVKWVCQDQTIPLLQYSGSIVIYGVGEDSPAADFNKFTLTAKGDGPLNAGIVIPGSTGNIYYGVQDTGDDPVDFSNFISGDPNQDILIAYGNVAMPKFYWMAHSINGTRKTDYTDQSDTNNSGSIGGETDLFEVREITIGDNQFLLYITRYPTLFGSSNQRVLFSRAQVPADPVQPPTNVQANYTNPGDGYAHLNISWTDSVTPTDKTYTVRIIDVTTGDTFYIPAGSSTSLEFLTGLFGHNYLISVRTETSTPDQSVWTADISLNVPALPQKYDVSVAVSSAEANLLRRKISVTTSVNVDTTIVVRVKIKVGSLNEEQYDIQITSGSNIGYYNSGTVTPPYQPVQYAEVVSVTPSSSNTQNYVY